jgi:hypothetical protein
MRLLRDRDGQIAVMFSIKLLAQLFRSNEGDEDRICIHTSHKDADNLAVVVPFRHSLGGRQRKALADGGFNGSTSRGDEISELVRCTDHERPDGTRSQLHQVDGNDPPGALYTELFEEGRCHDRGRGYIRVWVQKSTTNDADENDRKASAKDLASPAAHRTARHGAQISNYLRYRHGIRGEVELRREEGWVEILGAMGLEEKHQRSIQRNRGA